MKRLAVCAILILFAVSLGFAQGAATTPPAASPAAAQPPPQTGTPEAQTRTIRGVLPLTSSKTLDSKKLKEGDSIVCVTAAGVHLGNGTMVPSGAKVIGHVVAAKARSKGDAESSLQIAFDKIQMPNGKDIIMMKGTLIAVAPDPGGHSGVSTGAASPGTMPGPGGEGTMAPGTDSALSGPNSGYHSLSGGGTSHPLLTSQSRGVLGFPNMQMDKNSSLTTTGKELKLDNGTQMLIQAEIPVPVK